MVQGKFPWELDQESQLATKADLLRFKLDVEQSLNKFEMRLPPDPIEKLRQELLEKQQKPKITGPSFLFKATIIGWSLACIFLLIIFKLLDKLQALQGIN
jgi:hypothetical protein